MDQKSVRGEAVEIITVQELACEFRVSRKTIYNLVYRRRIPFIKVGGALRFRRSELEEWLKNGGLNARPK